MDNAETKRLVEILTNAPCIVENPWGAQWDGPCEGSHAEGGGIHIPCAVAALLAHKNESEDNAETVARLTDTQRRALLAIHENSENQGYVRTKDLRRATADRLAALGLVELSYVGPPPGTTEIVGANFGRSWTTRPVYGGLVARITEAGRDLAHSLGGTPKGRCVEPGCSSIIDLSLPGGRCRYHGPGGRGHTESLKGEEE